MYVLCLSTSGSCENEWNKNVSQQVTSHQDRPAGEQEKWNLIQRFGLQHGLQWRIQHPIAIQPRYGVFILCSVYCIHFITCVLTKMVLYWCREFVKEVKSGDQEWLVHTSVCCPVVTAGWSKRLHFGKWQQYHSNITSGSCSREAAPFAEKRCMCFIILMFMKMYFDFDFNSVVCDCIRWGDVWTWSWHQTVLFLHFPRQQALMVSKHPKQRGLEQSQLQPAPPQHLLHLNCAAQLLPEVLFHTQHINIVDKSCLLTNCILLLVCLCRSMQQCSCGQKSVRLVTRIVD